MQLLMNLKGFKCKIPYMTFLKNIASEIEMLFGKNQ